MMNKTSCALAIAASAWMAAGPAVGQDTPRWYGIDCSHSRITVPAGLKCTTTQNYAGGENGWGGNAGGTFRGWMASGAADSAGVFYYLVEGTSLGAALMESASLKQAIRSEMGDGDKLANFSALGNRGGADYMTFTSASGDACVGIRRYGPAQGAGYQWILYGVRCEPRGRPITDTEIDRFIGGAAYRGPAASG
jgi:hypothetical protein